MSLPGLFSLYRDKFLPIYGDYVALTFEKPEQILFQESNILSHIAQANNPSLPPEKYQENVNKARHHLQRATLDLHKLVWVEIDKLLTPLMNDPKYIVCFNISAGEVLEEYKRFKASGMDSRRYELKHIGNDVDGAITKYDETNKTGLKLLEKRDGDKFARVTHMHKSIQWRSFGLGVLASIVAGFILWLVLPSSVITIKTGESSQTKIYDNSIKRNISDNTSKSRSM